MKSHVKKTRFTDLKRFQKRLNLQYWTARIYYEANRVKTEQGLAWKFTLTNDEQLTHLSWALLWVHTHSRSTRPQFIIHQLAKSLWHNHSYDTAYLEVHGRVTKDNHIIIIHTEASKFYRRNHKYIEMRLLSPSKLIITDDPLIVRAYLLCSDADLNNPVWRSKTKGMHTERWSPRVNDGKVHKVLIDNRKPSKRTIFDVYGRYPS